MLVDNEGNLWKCSGQFHKMELIPDVKVNPDSVIIEQALALTPEGLVINIETGKVVSERSACLQQRSYKSIRKLRDTILKHTHEGEVIVNDNLTSRTIIGVKLIAGSGDDTRLLMEDGRWLKSSHSWLHPERFEEVNNLPAFKDIVKVKGSCILAKDESQAKDELYDLIESQVYSSDFNIRDFCHFSFGDMVSSSNPVVVTESGQVFIGFYGEELVELDNGIIKDYNQRSKWKQVMYCIIEDSYVNLLINELGQAYMVTDEYGSLRTTNIPVELFRE